MPRLQSRVTVNHLISVLLLSSIVIALFFLWTYINKVSPVSIAKNNVVPANYLEPPEFLHLIDSDNKYIKEPYDLDVAGDGSLYVVDSIERDIKVFDPNGRFLFKFGKKGKGKGQFIAPVSVAVTKDRVWVTDGLTMRVQSFTLQGDYVAELITPEINKRHGAIRPLGLSSDVGNNLYLTDIFYQRAIKFSSNGGQVLVFGGAGQDIGRFSYPNDLALDSRGNIYVADSNNSRVQVFNADGKPFQVYGLKGKDLEFGVTIPRGIAVDDRDLLYVCDPAASQVVVIKTDNKKPELLFKLDSSGEKAPLYMPQSVAVYKNKIFVADTGHKSIFVFGY